MDRDDLARRRAKLDQATADLDAALDKHILNDPRLIEIHDCKTPEDYERFVKKFLEDDKT
ncbi:MAG TPA: hypothetical protein VIS51_10060 [Solirubrobacterales bacterium]